MKENQITEGPVLTSIIKYFIPIFLGSLIQQSYSIVDAIIIGRYAGVFALASIDATYNFTKLVINIFISISLGGTIIIAQNYGAKKFKEVSKISHVLILLALLGGVLMTLFGLILTPTFIQFMNVPLELSQMSKSYLEVYFLGTSFSFIFNIGAGILRSLGDTKKPFYYLVISSLLNIALDILFIGVFGLGVAGAALGTVISQGLSSILIIKQLYSNQRVSLRIKKLKFDTKVIRSVLKIGIPMGLQTSAYVIANMFMQMGINSFGEIHVAGWAICGKLDFMLWLVVDAIGLTSTTFIAQNYGANLQQRIKKSFVHLLWFSSLLVGMMSLLIYLNVEFMTSLFTDDSTVIRTTVEMMKLIAPFYVITTLSSVISGVIKGLGDTFNPMIITLICTCMIRIIWVLLPHEVVGDVILGYPITWTATLLGLLLYGKRKLHTMNKNQIANLS